MTWTNLNKSAGVNQVGLLLNLLDDSSLDLCGIHSCDVCLTAVTLSVKLAWATVYRKNVAGWKNYRSGAGIHLIEILTSDCYAQVIAIEVSMFLMTTYCDTY